MVRAMELWSYCKLSTELEFQCFGESVCCFLPVILSVGFLPERDFWPCTDQHKCRCEQLEFGSCQDVMTAMCEANTQGLVTHCESMWEPGE